MSTPSILDYNRGIPPYATVYKLPRDTRFRFREAFLITTPTYVGKAHRQHTPWGAPFVCGHPAPSMSRYSPLGEATESAGNMYSYHSQVCWLLCSVRSRVEQLDATISTVDHPIFVLLCCTLGRFLRHPAPVQAKQHKPQRLENARTDRAVTLPESQPDFATHTTDFTTKENVGAFEPQIDA